VTKITNWKAENACLEIVVWITPWDKTAQYRREYISEPNSYAVRWAWLDGNKDSGCNTRVNSDIQEILNDLILDHESLSLFCKIYGIKAVE
jgi:hypothetical protein